jgi:hypothetical protein
LRAELIAGLLLIAAPAFASPAFEFGAIAEAPIAGFGGAPVAFGADVRVRFEVEPLWLGLRTSWLSWGAPPWSEPVFGYGMLGGGATTGPSTAWVFALEARRVLLKVGPLSLEAMAALGARWSWFTNGSQGGDPPQPVGKGIYPEADLGVHGQLRVFTPISLVAEARVATLLDVHTGPPGQPPHPLSTVGVGLDLMLGLRADF